MTDKQFTQELRLDSNNTAIKWLVGAYYYNAKSSYDPAIVNFGPTPATNPAFPIGAIQIDSSLRTRSVAGFGQATAPITDRLNVTLGLRYTHERRVLEGTQVGLLLVPGAPISLGSVPHAGKTFKSATYRAAVDYALADDVMVYASVSSGFKSGGYDTSTITNPPFRPEKLTAYEAGVKSQFLDNRVRLNVAGFYYDYKDLQVQRQLQAGNSVINGSAEIYGADVDLTFAVSNRLSLRANIEALHSKFLDFPGAQFTSTTGGVPVTAFQARGNRLPYASNFAGSFGFDYEMPVGDGSITFNGTAYHDDGWFARPDNLIAQPSYWMFNASANWKVADTGLSLSVWGRNLSNEPVSGYAVTTFPIGNLGQSLEAPRTYGGTIGLKF
nr:TonB-dependent receptor [Sphingobium sp. AntQ-1]